MAESVDLDRRRVIAQGAITFAGAQIGAFAAMQAKDRTSREMTALGRAADWLNSARLTPSDLAGKVVVVDFCTYTCINWLRTLPYVRAWSQKYKPGIVVIGVHTPEFPFERNIDNVRRAVQQMRIDFPIVIDSDYAIWRAFKNQYWPALYFIDARGQIRDHQFGEGEYERSEKIIRRLLADAGGQPSTIPSHQSAATASRPRQTGAACDRRKTTSGTSERRTSLQLPLRTGLASIPRPVALHSMNGRSPANGRSASRP
jgi:thiol-disulfide isomerase/thioredoxin